jgi:hypothetical protein
MNLNIITDIKPCRSNTYFINPTTVHHSYSKLNTTHGSSGHLEPEHPQLGCIHFLFTMSNQQTRAKALVITNRSWYLYVLLLIFIVSPQSPAGISIPSGFRTTRFGPQSRPGSLINIATLLRNSKCRWWRQTGSNRRPHACKARALPTELCPLYD